MTHPYFCEHTQVQQDFYNKGYAQAIEDVLEVLKSSCHCPEQGFQNCDHGESLSHRIKYLSRMGEK